jgi:5'-nucleotidase
MRIALLLLLLPALPARADPVTVVVVGTTDVHGHLEAVEEELPLDGGGKARVRRGGAALLGGYLEILRKRYPGRVVLVDAGDMMQGTLLSNLGEGAAVMRAMNALGYAAAALGNHEFDYGPVGPRATPKAKGDDPRGALKARAAEARFPWLTSNVRDGAAPVGAPRVREWTIVDAGGVKVGLVGGTSEDTPRTTIRPNLVGITVEPLAQPIERAAKAARAAGAEVVVAVVHAGGECARFEVPEDLSSCLPDAEVWRLAKALPAGTVDAIVGGHTHQAVAHRVNGVPVVQAFSYGGWFSRVDLTVDGGRVVGTKIHPPEEICAEVADGVASCDARRARGKRVIPATYEGAPVVADGAVERAFAGDVRRAAALRAEKIGVVLPKGMPRQYRAESPLGNLVADLLRESAPGAEIGITNGGGLRGDLPPGDLTYGALFEALPFENKLALIRMPGALLARIIKSNMAGSKGILSLSGARVKARCGGAKLEVAVEIGGKPLDERAIYTVATSDFLALGGDDFGGAIGALPAGAVSIDEEGGALRDRIRPLLVARGAKGPLLADDPAIFDAAHPRVALPAARPFHCPVP